jgi:hypothetical protein
VQSALLTLIALFYWTPPYRYNTSFSGLRSSPIFICPKPLINTDKGYTLVQKSAGKACGLPGLRPSTAYAPLKTIGFFSFLSRAGASHSEFFYKEK